MYWAKEVSKSKSILFALYILFLTCYTDCMDIKVILVKAFTTHKDAGNPAGVILNADNLSTEQMQAIATRLGFSESVFVCKSEAADCKMRYFSVTQEVDYCAHATVAAVHVLKDIKSHETRAGIFSLSIDKQDKVTIAQKAPEFGEMLNDWIIAHALGIQVDEMGKYPEVVSTGVPKLIVGVKTLDTLFRIRPNFEEIKRLCRAVGARGVYVFTAETILETSDYHARQFNPLCGINEDPVTGIAAGALAAYIAVSADDNTAEIVIEQGYCMDKFGIIEAHVNEDKVLIKGNAVIYGEQIITL